jgi:hypothetical protein
MSETGEAAVLVGADDRTLPDRYVGPLQPNYWCRAWNSKRDHYCGARAGAGTAHPGAGRCRHHGGVKEGGDARLTHGQRRSRYMAERAPVLTKLIEEYETSADPLDILPDLAMARALRDRLVASFEIADGGGPAVAATIPADEQKALRDLLDDYEQQLREGEPTSRQEAQLASARKALESIAAQQPAAQTLGEVGDATRLLDVISKIIHRYEQIRSANAISYDQLKRFLFAVERVIEARVRDPELVQRIRDDILAVRL